MSAIDWEAKPEPWRTIGQRFVAELDWIMRGGPRPPCYPIIRLREPKQLNHSWTTTELDQLADLRDQGLSFEAIAAHFGDGFTRTQVKCALYRADRRR
jgi:hypothetical protein